MHFTLRPDSKKTWVATDGDWLANLYWGFSLQKPPGNTWQGKVKLNSVEIFQSQVGAVAKIDALPAVYSHSQAQLTRLQDRLRRTFDNFRVIESGLQVFNIRPRPLDSLYIDFTCTLSGAAPRCRQYIIPRRGRSYRVSLWAPADRFESLLPELDAIARSMQM